jgi:hypothetical protein
MTVSRRRLEGNGPARRWFRSAKLPTFAQPAVPILVRPCCRGYDAPVRKVIAKFVRFAAVLIVGILLIGYFANLAQMMWSHGLSGLGHGIGSMALGFVILLFGIPALFFGLFKVLARLANRIEFGPASTRSPLDYDRVVVRHDSFLADLGLLPGDVVTSVDAQPVKNWGDFKKVLANVGTDPRTQIALLASQGYVIVTLGELLEALKADRKQY